MESNGHLSRPVRAGRLSLAVAAAATMTLAGSTPPAHAHHIPKRDPQRKHIVTRARSQIGSPYRTAGASPGGFDCSGFTMWVFAEHGAQLPHSAAAQYNMGDTGQARRIYKMRHLEPGDLVFHRTTSAAVGHVGIYVGNQNFISATSSSGIQVRSLHDPYYWGSRYVGAVRLRATMDPAARTDRTEPRPPNRVSDQKDEGAKPRGRGSEPRRGRGSDQRRGR